MTTEVYKSNSKTEYIEDDSTRKPRQHASRFLIRSASSLLQRGIMAEELGSEREKVYARRNVPEVLQSKNIQSY